MSTVECVLDCRAELAEGPVWDPEDGVLYWVNIKGTVDLLGENLKKHSWAVWLKR
jgi:sugar lactone lactonase YvrE